MNPSLAQGPSLHQQRNHMERPLWSIRPALPDKAMQTDPRPQGSRRQVHCMHLMAMQAGCHTPPPQAIKYISHNAQTELEFNETYSKKNVQEIAVPCGK